MKTSIAEPVRAVILTRPVRVQGVEQYEAILIDPLTRTDLHRLTRWSVRGAVSDLAVYALRHKIEITQVA